MLHWKGWWVTPPTLSKGAQPMLSRCPPDTKCQPQWHLQPTVTAPTALATPFNRLSNRLWGRLRGPFPSNASLCESLGYQFWPVQGPPARPPNCQPNCLPNQQPRSWPHQLPHCGGMKERIPRYRMPPCHRRTVTTCECSAALQHFRTSSECCLEFARRLSNVP